MMTLARILAAVGSALSNAAVVHPRVTPPMAPALASWYDDGGPTASGRHYTDGFASLIAGDRWGTAVQFCYRGRCVTGYLDDHGPYVTGRTFDLNPQLHAALACPDLCWLRWRYIFASRNNSG
jgi:hypothetical protein